MGKSSPNSDYFFFLEILWGFLCVFFCVFYLLYMCQKKNWTGGGWVLSGQLELFTDFWISFTLTSPLSLLFPLHVNTYVMGLRHTFFNSFSAGTVLIRQNLTSTDVRFWRLNTVPSLKGLIRWVWCAITMISRILYSLVSLSFKHPTFNISLTTWQMRIAGTNKRAVLSINA